MNAIRFPIARDAYCGTRCFDADEEEQEDEDVLNVFGKELPKGSEDTHKEDAKKTATAIEASKRGCGGLLTGWVLLSVVLGLGC